MAGDCASVAFGMYYGCGLLAQIGLTIWILVDASNSLFNNDSTVVCPSKVHDWTTWIFIWSMAKFEEA